MIAGVQIDVTSKELREHIEARATHHRTKAEFYRGQVDSLTAVDRTPQLDDDSGARETRGKATT